MILKDTNFSRNRKEGVLKMKDSTHIALLVTKKHLIFLINEEKSKKDSITSEFDRYEPNQFTNASHIVNLLDVATTAELTSIDEDGNETINSEDITITTSNDGNQIRIESANFYWTHSGILNVSFSQTENRKV